MNELTRLTRPIVNITREDWDAAAEFKPNCGPTALAVITGVGPVRACQSIPGFKDRHYTNPTMMAAALESLGIEFVERDDADCDGHTLTCYGLVRIQWAGPWTRPGENQKWAYRQTHWVAAAKFDDTTWVFDINNHYGWLCQRDWEMLTVPVIARAIPRATGNWWATHRWELHI